MIFRILNIMSPEQNPQKCGKKNSGRGKLLALGISPCWPSSAVWRAHMPERQNVGRFQPGNSFLLLTQHWVLSHSCMHDESSCQNGGGCQKPAIHFLACLWRLIWGFPPVRRTHLWERWLGKVFFQRKGNILPPRETAYVNWTGCLASCHSQQ